MEGELVCKYVMRGGESIGESIDVHKDRLIVKVGSDFLAVSMKNIEKVESDKIYVSEFDQKKAEDAGKKWIDEKSKPVSLEELKVFGFEDPTDEDQDDGEGDEGQNNKGESIEVGDEVKEVGEAKSEDSSGSGFEEGTEETEEKKE
ncbi:MAG: DUF5749 family beta-barrel protein [Archaeoglobaceae archaeon]